LVKERAISGFGYVSRPEFIAPCSAAPMMASTSLRASSVRSDVCCHCRGLTAEPQLLGVFHVRLLDLAIELERGQVVVFNPHWRAKVDAEVEGVVGGEP